MQQLVPLGPEIKVQNIDKKKQADGIQEILMRTPSSKSKQDKITPNDKSSKKMIILKSALSAHSANEMEKSSSSSPKFQISLKQLEKLLVSNSNSTLPIS